MASDPAEWFEKYLLTPKPSSVRNLKIEGIGVSDHYMLLQFEVSPADFSKILSYMKFRQIPTPYAGNAIKMFGLEPRFPELIKSGWMDPEQFDSPDYFTREIAVIENGVPRIYLYTLLVDKAREKCFLRLASLKPR